MFEQIELQAKLLNYFLGSNKNNINQLNKVQTPLPLGAAGRACKNPVGTAAPLKCLLGLWAMLLLHLSDG